MSDVKELANRLREFGETGRAEGGLYTMSRAFMTQAADELDRLTERKESYHRLWNAAEERCDRLTAEVSRLRGLLGDSLTAESQAMGLYDNRVKCDCCGGLTPDAWVVHEEGDRTECLRCWHSENERELRAEIRALRARVDKLETALWHYANKDNWRWCKEHFYPGDGPDVARSALRAAEGESK